MPLALGHAFRSRPGGRAAKRLRCAIASRRWPKKLKSLRWRSLTIGDGVHRQAPLGDETARPCLRGGAPREGFRLHLAPPADPLPGRQHRCRKLPDHALRRTQDRAALRGSGDLLRGRGKRPVSPGETVAVEAPNSPQPFGASGEAATRTWTLRRRSKRSERSRRVEAGAATQLQSLGAS